MDPRCLPGSPQVTMPPIPHATFPPPLARPPPSQLKLPPHTHTLYVTSPNLTLPPHTSRSRPAPHATLRYVALRYVGEFKTIWKIAQDEGGLMNYEFGVKVAKNWAKWAEKKRGMMTYDKAGGCLRYMHWNQGALCFHMFFFHQYPRTEIW